MSRSQRQGARPAAYRALLAGGSASLALLSGGAATAQEAPDQGQAAVELGEVVVTGSRIARRDYASNSPLVSVTAEAIENTGQVTVEKALTQMPQFSGAMGQSTSGSSSTSLNGGQAYASLRGLGSKRTLLLLDGKRLQPSNPDGSVDLNIIPEALIGNVEVITGGASTAYGSDATAGVVNFRLKRDFSGVTVASQYGVSDYGDGESFRLSVTAGDRFADDRGRAVISLDYSMRDTALQAERDYYYRRNRESNTAIIAQGTAQFGTNRPTLAAVNDVFVGQYGTAPVLGVNGFYNGQIGFNTGDQTLFNLGGASKVMNLRDPETDNAFLNAAGTNMLWGWTRNSVQNDNERYSLFSRVDYEVAPNVDFFIQGSLTSYQSEGIFNPTLAGLAYALNVPVTNPYIGADFAKILASRPNPTADFVFWKDLDFAGPRLQSYAYDVYQFISGLSGDVGYKDWTWEAYVSVSKAQFENNQTGGVSRAAISRLLYSPTGGSEFCSGGLNPFGNHVPSAECANYVTRRTTNTNELTQRMAEVTVQGGLFTLPAGEVRFAVGADYRYNHFAFQPDSLLDQPDGTSDILGYSPLRASSGEVDTTEVYAEFLVPLLRDLPFIQELELDLGYRYSDYSSVGGVHAYKADLNWRINEPLRLRGGYNRAVRAPSVGELYSPISSATVDIGTATGANTSGDPCDIRSSFRNGPDGAKVRQLCIDLGVPSSIIDTYQFGASQVFALTGGNPQLEEETADTYSFGAVVQSTFKSPWLSNITASIDWYQIKVSEAVGTLGVGNAIRYCFNNGGNNPTYDKNNYYCSLQGRSAADGNMVAPRQPLLNLGQFNVTGVDLQFDWRLHLADIGLPDDGTLSFGSAISYLSSFEIQALPGAPTYDYAGTWGTAIEANAGQAHPEWKANSSITYSRDSWNIGLRWRHMSEMMNSARVTSPTSTTLGVDVYDVFDLNARVDAPYGTTLRFTVTNLFNEAPPQVGDVRGTYDPQNYDVLGRYYTVAVSKTF
ncbi:TonB-dependent receptor domain-containing protein [Brevundimonas sp. P7753]|uniref:TonB-dependent receptor domain-containing protein n=1 Tax=Brevundimonas sp. P7753 TaxID=2726982 RepID=UPI0015BA3AFD|nr:TonB-dependent receptor [Brevundimonas sp. P7753]NWE52999.1 TonB-dependent receptor [Brevundimonas sp. P7753]